MSELYAGQTALVTGGLGFVGRHLVDGLLLQGAEKVIVVDDCSNSSPEMPAHWDRVEHLNTSVTDDEWLSRVDDAQAVFHLACKTLLECGSNPEYDLQVNALSTLRILEHIRRLDGRKPNFVYTSSACVYGLTPDRPIDETYPTVPSHQYGVSKLAGENYTRMYGSTYGLNTAALRLSNVYGPGQTPRNPYCGVIGIFLNQATEGQPLTVIGDGGQSRDFTYATDTANAIMAVGADAGNRGEVYNVSAGRALTVSEVAEEVQNLFPRTEILHTPPRSIDDIRHRWLDSSSIESKFGWTATTSLREGLAAASQSLR